MPIIPKFDVSKDDESWMVDVRVRGGGRWEIFKEVVQMGGGIKDTVVGAGIKDYNARR